MERSSSEHDPSKPRSSGSTVPKDERPVSGQELSDNESFQVSGLAKLVDEITDVELAQMYLRFDRWASSPFNLDSGECGISGPAIVILPGDDSASGFCYSVEHYELIEHGDDCCNFDFHAAGKGSKLNLLGLNICQKTGLRYRVVPDGSSVFVCGRGEMCIMSPVVDDAEVVTSLPSP